MIRRAAALAGWPSPAARRAPARGDRAQRHPDGQHSRGRLGGAPGILPANTQAQMYDRLTPLGRDVTDARLAPSADGTATSSRRSCSPPDDPRSSPTRRSAGARNAHRAHPPRRLRRPARLLRQRRRRHLRRGLRHRRRPQPAARPGARQRHGGGDRHPRRTAIQLVLGLYQYQPTARVRRGHAPAGRARCARRRRRPPGAARHRHLPRGINQLVRREPARRAAFDRADVYALNAIKAQFLGEGGGDRGRERPVPRHRARQLGARRGTHAYEDLRQRNDRDVDHDPPAAPHQTKVPARRPNGLVRLAKGTFQSAGVRAAGRRARPPRPPPGAARRRRTCCSSTATRSATGTPIMVGGPQIGYNYPGLTMEMGLYGPTLRARGATSAPFPGYMLIGRGERLRVDADLGRRRHHRHLRRAAVRRLAHAVPLQGHVPQDADGERRHDHQGRRQRQRPLPAHRARAGRRLRPRGGHASGVAPRRALERRAARRPTRSSSSGSLRPGAQRAGLPPRGGRARRRRSTRSTPTTRRSRS